MDGGTMTGNPAVEFLVWGPVEVRIDGHIRAAGRPQQRAVLAALLVDAGRVVPVDVLVDRVWGEARPQRARRMLHTHVTRIRRLLESLDPDPVCGSQVSSRLGGSPASPSGQLVRHTGGYVLDVDTERVDVHRFRCLVDQSRDPRRRDDERVALLREALALSHGEPLAGVPGAWAERVRETWRHWRLDAVVAWAGAEVQVANHEVVISSLAGLVQDHPLVEPLAAMLMRALYAAGRGAEALECYTGVRQRLVDELGADPGAELQTLHQAILRGEQAGRPEPRPSTSAAAAVAGPAGTVPAQLPADVTAFAGRNEYLSRLDALLTGSASAAGPPTAVVLTAVSGTAGIGKTALAVHWAHQVRHRFPDGQLYVNLRGFDPGGQVMDPAEAVRGFLDALDVPPQRVPASLDAQAALYRSLLDGKRMLVVLDNARDADQVRPLLPGTSQAVAVVTSRHQLSSLVAVDGAHPVTLDLPTAEEARQLLVRRLGHRRVAAEPAAVEDIITWCARLPLALTIAASRAAQTGFPLRAVAAELAEASGRLDALSAGDAASEMRAVFSWSYTMLIPAAAQLFRLLGLHPGPDISAAAAASLAGLSLPDTRHLLAELTRASLLTEHTPGRYTFHDLLRAYATDLTHTQDSADQRRAAVGRILDHYMHTAHNAACLLDPARDEITLALVPPGPGVSPEQPADHGQALAWLTSEHPVLLVVVRLAAEAGFDTHTWQLTWALDTFLDRQGHWHDLTTAWQTALSAARKLNDPAAQAYAHRYLAWAHIRLGRYPDAHSCLEHALNLSARADDHAGQAHTQNSLAVLREQQSQHAQALDHAQQAIIQFRLAGHRRGQASSLNTAGWCHVMLGDHSRALTCCQQALSLHLELGCRHGEAATWDSLGYAHHHLGNHTQAADCYQHALDLYRDLGDRYYEAYTLGHLGDTHHAAGDAVSARTAWQDALAIFTDLGHSDADQIRAKLADLGAPTKR